MRKNKHLGTNLDQFLQEEGLLAETEALAIKRILVRQIEQGMTKRGLSKIEMAKNMHTSRAALDRLLDQNNTSVTLNTIIKAAKSLEQRISINFC